MSDIEKELEDVIEHIKTEEDITLANHTEKDSVGVGDTLHKVFTKFGITEEKITKFFHISGSCGCDERRKFLNTIFPYRKRSSNHGKVE